MHPSEDLLEAYVMRHTDHAVCQNIEGHLRECESCQQVFVEVKSYVREIKIALRAGSQSEKRSQQITPNPNVIVDRQQGKQLILL